MAPGRNFMKWRGVAELLTPVQILNHRFKLKIQRFKGFEWVIQDLNRRQVVLRPSSNSLNSIPM